MTWSATGTPGTDGASVIAEGFTTSAAGGSYAVVIENPRATPIAVQAKARFLTAAGQNGLERTFTVPYIGPGEREGWVDALPDGMHDQFVRMAVTLADQPPGDSSSTAVVATVSGVASGGPPVATVLLTNHNAEPVLSARLSVVAYAADGSVLGGGTRTTPSLLPHLDTQLVVPLVGIADPARVEPFIAFTEATRFGAEP